MIFLYIALLYFAIGAVAGRYTWRTAKRMVSKGVHGWSEGPEDFWYSFFLWPAFGPIYLNASLKQHTPGPVKWLMCAREPKKIRETQKLIALERELELDK